MNWKRKFVGSWGRLGMKSDWNIMKLSDIVDFNPSESIKKGTIAKKVPMDKLRPFYRDIPEYVEEVFTGGTKFRNGDTIMARITPCLENGKIAKVSILDDNEVGFGSTEYIVFRAKEGISDTEFVYYLICSSEIRNLAIKSMVGSSGRQRVQTDVMRNIEIAVPPLKEQKKIGALLKLLDDKIVLNDRINKNLAKQCQLIFDDLYNSLEETEVTMSNIVDVRDGTHDSPKPQAEGMPLITSKHLLPFGVDKDAANLISLADYNKINERSMVATHDILLSMIGTVGIISLVTDNPVDFAIKNVGLFRTSQVPDLKWFIHSFLCSKATQQRIETFLAGSTQKYISLTELRKLPIRVPTTDMLDNYNSTVTPLYKAIISNHAENILLVKLRDSLLPKLLFGELDISIRDI